MMPREPNPAPARTGIIDIGSNSVRLVVYEGVSRAPAVLFNEKVMAGLGRGVANGGRLKADAMQTAETALARFALLAREMGVDRLRAVATAAVRDASNGRDFIARVHDRTGLGIEIIDGETEARGSALGVIAGIPDADGVVGDLGGGSLELIRVAGGEVHERLSMPVGSLVLDAARRDSPRALAKLIEAAMARVSWAEAGRGKPFYMVGGSWRALAQLYMHLTDYPLPVIHHFVMPAEAPARLVRTIAAMQMKSLKAVPQISTARLPQLPGAALLLRAVTGKLGSSCVIASAYGLREGLLYADLPDALRAEDPLIAGARAEAERAARFPGDGDALLAWSDGLFMPEPLPMRRLRHAACLLVDTSWRAHPDFRAERGVEVALHGNWVGITAPERAVIAATLFAALGGDADAPALAACARLAAPVMLTQARAWGLALRLGQRLGGGTMDAVARSRLARDGGTLTLTLPDDLLPLAGDTVTRRLKSLAGALGLTPRVAGPEANFARAM